MNTTEIERLIIEAIQEVAPEVERNMIDLDSMDFINYLAALQKLTGIKIIEGDYPKFHSINSALAFLNDKNS